MEDQILRTLDGIAKELNFMKQRMLANEVEEYLTVKEVCERYKWSRTKFNEMKRLNLIPVYKVRGKLLVKVSEINQFIDSMLVAA